MTVTDETNLDMKGFSKQKRYRILHTQGLKTPRDPPAATRKRLGVCPRRVPVPPFSGGTIFVPKMQQAPTHTTVPQLSTYVSVADAPCLREYSLRAAVHFLLFQTEGLLRAKCLFCWRPGCELQPAKAYFL